MPFPLLLICHSRTRCGNLSFFYNSACSLAAVTYLLRCGLPPALHRYSTAAARLFFARRADNTEAKAVEGAIGVVTVLAVHLAVVGGVVAPAAAAAAALVAVGIPAPFPNIAAHVVQAVAVRLFLRYWVCLASAVATIPAHFVQIAAAAVLKFLSAFCRILPFVYCWQAIAIGIEIAVYGIIFYNLPFTVFFLLVFVIVRANACKKSF